MRNQRLHSLSHAANEPKLTTAQSSGTRRSPFRALATKLLLALLPFAALYIYQDQLLEANSYYGFEDIEVDSSFIQIYLIWITILIAVYPATVRYPSDLFIALNLAVGLLWPAAYWKSTNTISETQALFLFATGMIPIVALLAVRKSLINIFKALSVRLTLFPKSLLPLVLLMALVVASMLGYVTNGQAGSFDFDALYDRRLIGRDTFGDSRMSGYIYQMCANGIAPLLAFLSACVMKRRYAFCALLFSIFDFWLLGTKSTFLYVTSMYAMGTMYRIGAYRNISSYLVYLLSAAFIIAFAEIFLGHDPSSISDVFIRRTFLVPSQIQTYFIDRIFVRSSFEEFLYGLHLNGAISPAYLIGSEYFGNKDTNANVNAFIYSLALSGVVGYLICVAFICISVSFLDYLFQTKRSGELFAIAAIYSFLLLEQAYTTVLASSGVFLCLLLVLTFSKQDHRIKRSSLARPAEHQTRI